MNNPTKTIILLLILWAVALLMSWCAVQSQVAKQIELSEKEIAKQELVIENAKAELAKNKKIAEAGKAYIEALGNNIPKEEKTAEIKQEPTVAPTLWGYICLVDDKGNTEYREYKDNDVEYLKECWAFAWKDECYIAPDWANCLKKQ